MSCFRHAQVVALIFTMLLVGFAFGAAVVAFIVRISWRSELRRDPPASATGES